MLRKKLKSSKRKEQLRNYQNKIFNKKINFYKKNKFYIMKKSILVVKRKMIQDTIRDILNNILSHWY